MMMYLIDSTAPLPPRMTSLAGLRADATGPGCFETNWLRRIQDLPGHIDAQLLIVQPSETVADITRRVISAVQSPHRIWMLRIVAHGVPGRMQLGRGVGPREAAGFNLLQRYFSVTGRGVEIHSCNLAATRTGEQLMQALADAFGQQVAASPQLQLADNGFRFEGTVSRATPRPTSR